MKLEQLQAAENKLLVQTYQRSPHLFVEGRGVHLIDDQGNEFLDLLSGIGVSALGYGHPAITAAVAAQAPRLLHTSNLFFHEHTAPLALRLTEISGLDRVFFCNSGTEAWEAALKIARAHATLSTEQGKPLGRRFLALEHSFHGRTIGSVATTYKFKYREPFAPVMPDVDFVRFNDVEHLRELFSADVCAICIEPIQGEGGVHPVSQEFFAAARELCDFTGALLLADEIQCGFGRTGDWFAYQHFDVLPDVVTLAKPLAGGLPIGCMLVTDRVAAAFSPGMHGTTFGGGPLITAVASAVIDTIRQDNLLHHIREIGGYFFERLSWLATQHPSIVDVRGRGLMLGLELQSADHAATVVEAMLARHIIINRTSETVLRFLPPYIIQRVHVDQAIDSLDHILNDAPVLANHASSRPGDSFHE